MLASPLVLLSTLFLSIPLLFYFSPQFIISQLPTPDDPDDLALFRLATSPKPGPIQRLGRPINPKPKIAFLFLTNTDLHFSPLWEKFFYGHSHLHNIYVHADPTARIPSPLSGVFSGTLIKSKKTERGSPTLISAARRLIATALVDDPLNYYFALVSQHCIPLHSFKFTYKTLFSSPKISTGESTPSLFPSRLSYIEILSDEPQLWDRYTARGEHVMMPEVRFEDFRVGSQFFTLNRKHAVMVTKDRKLWRKFRMPCLNIDSCYPEEHYFPTLLSMEDPRGCSHYTLTRVNWTGSTGGHPFTYGPGDVSGDLIRELRVSNSSSSYEYLFARKFSPDCLNPLMDLADRVIFR